MSNGKHSLVKQAAVWLLLVAVASTGYKMYHRWREFNSSEQGELSKKKEWVYGRVQNSAAGSRPFMVAVAREFTGKKDADLGYCEWSASPMWRHSTKNPNWISDIKGSNGMLVIDDCEIKDGSSRVPDMQFEWEWQDGRGVIWVSWDWAPDEP